MIGINFLPWRARRRAVLQGRYYLLLAGAGLAALLHLAVLSWQLQQDNHSWRQEQQRLLLALQGSEQRLADAEANRQSLLQLLNWLAEVGALRQQGRDNAWLLGMLATRVPDGLMLTRLERQGAQLRVEGRVLSEALLTRFLRQLTAEGPLERPVLDLLGAEDHGPEGGVSAGKPFRVTLSFAGERPVSGGVVK